MKLTILYIALLLTLNTPVQANNSYEYNFDGKGNKSFTVLTGNWKVMKDKSSPSKPNVLAQLAKSTTSDFNVVLFNSTNHKDLEVSVKMKVASGDIDQGGGIVWRAKDINNYYIARYNPLEENYRVYKVENGKRTMLQSANIKHNDGWHNLLIKMQEDHIQCFYDDKKYLDVKDPTFTASGKIGLWTKADARTYFDDLAVQIK